MIKLIVTAVKILSDYDKNGRKLIKSIFGFRSDGYSLIYRF